MSTVKVSTLKKKADKLFSEYIRKRDADDQGYGTCVTCGKKEPWEDMDAGHFVSRAELATRYDEENVFIQCRYCNRFRNGRPAEYARFLIDRFGEEHIDKLSRKSRNIVHDSREHIESVIEKLQ